MKGISKFTLVIFVWLWIVPASSPQEKLTLTLDKSIQMALAQNPYHLASGKKVDAAQSRVKEAFAGFFPSISAQGLKTLDEKVFELEFPSIIPGETAQTVEFDFTRDYQFSFALSVPIFTGGRLVGGLKQANNNLKSSREVLRQSKHQTIFNTKKAFYGILLAREFVQVSEEAVAVSEKLYNNIKIQYEVGLSSQFDLLRSEVQLANLKPQLIKARNNLSIMELNLKTILGLDLAKEIDIMGELIFKSFEPDLESCLGKALQNRPEIKQMEFQKLIAREGLKIARASRLPTVSISGQFNYWADAFNFKKDNWQDYYTINLMLNIPIFNGFVTSARVGQARANFNELEYTQKGLKEMLKFEVRQSVLLLQEARESLISQEKNVEQAQESLRIAELNFAEGLVTMLDINQTQAALTQAKSNYSQALYDYVLALAELDRAMGTE